MWKHTVLQMYQVKWFSRPLPVKGKYTKPQMYQIEWFFRPLPVIVVSVVHEKICNYNISWRIDRGCKLEILKKNTNKKETET